MKKTDIKSNLDAVQLNLHPGELAVRKVASNCHISFEGVYYSVPHELMKSMVIVRAKDSIIDILDNNGMCVACHKRCSIRRTYITDPSHMPHFYYSDHSIACFDGSLFRCWAQDIGNNTYDLIEALLNKKQFEEQSYKSCMAVLQLSRKHSKQRLEDACRRALDSGRINFYAVRDFIA